MKCWDMETRTRSGRRREGWERKVLTAPSWGGRRRARSRRRGWRGTRRGCGRSRGRSRGGRQWRARRR
ncbi:unnamed protein product [Spirodela intermedia]|uniref:Uncharacterized protein n=1 Tax=Spirodela intermedia TaxID=51605 RepID=A0A7I8KRL7_SPIIN|nr:unnamed protein product [Spirodela intermedia]